MLALAALVALAPVATGFGDAGAFDSGREAVAPVVPADAHDAAVADADDAGADAFASGNAKASETKEPSPSFAVYRMLGNDMWPLQGVGQMRRNSVFAARHEAAPPPDVPVFWIVNRVVDAAERKKLTSALAAEKNVSAGSLLFASPPLRDAKCLFASDASSLTDLPNNANATTTAKRTDDWERAATFAQAQNAVRNAAVSHARERGYDWAVPLDGNQFLPSDFYARMREALREAQANNHVAALIPMLRVREEQTSDAYGPRADAASVAARHLRADGKFAVSEPQIALHATEAALNGFQFDPESAYGAGNKAGLVRRLCPVQTRGGGGPGEGGARALCCELVDMKRRQQGDSYYYGAELDLSRVVAKSKGVKTGPDATDADRARLRRLTLDAAARLFSKCSVSVRLFNYAPEDGPSQLEIATSVLTRSKTRDEAGVAFRKNLERYLARIPSPKPETCAALDATRATLVADDPEARFFETLDLETLETLETETPPTPPTREARGTDVVRNARFVLENATTTHSRTAATAEAGKKKRPDAPSTADGVGREFFFGVPFFGAVAFAAWRRASRRRRGTPLSR